MSKKRAFYIIACLICVLSTSLKAEDIVIWHGDQIQKKMAFTFDDGPKPGISIKLLNLLRKHHVKATFFVVGKECKENPDLLYRMNAEGHEIANHTYSHRRLDAIPTDEIRGELVETNKIIRDISGKTVKYFRPPGGKSNQAVIKILRDINQKMVMYDVNANDYVRTNPYFGKNGEYESEKIVERIINKAQNGSILLMHNGSLETLKALPKIIETLRKDGYTFVTLSDLLNS